MLLLVRSASADPYSLYVSTCALVCPLIKTPIDNGAGHPISPFALAINIYVVRSSFVTINRIKIKEKIVKQ